MIFVSLLILRDGFGDFGGFGEMVLVILVLGDQF